MREKPTSQRRESSNDLRFDLRDPVLERISLTVSAIMLLLTPLAGFGAFQTWVTSETNVIQWASPNLPSQIRLNRYADRFGRPESIVFAWPECILQSPVPQRIVSRLTEDRGKFFSRVVCVHNILDAIDVDGGLSRHDAIARLRGVMISRDSEFCWMVAFLNDAGIADRAAAFASVREAASDEGVELNELRMAGVATNTHRLDVETRESAVHIAPFSGLLMFVIAWWSARSLKLAVVICLLSGYCGLVCAAAPYFCGVDSNALLSIQPTVAALLAVSFALHFNRYVSEQRRRAMDAFSGQSPVRTAVKMAFAPSLAASCTTAVGLLSLSLSETAPIRDFGYFGAFGVCVAFVLCFTVLPGLLCRMKIAPVVGRARLPLRLSIMIQRYRNTISIGALALLVFCALGLRHLSTGVDIRNFFVPRHPAICETLWLEQRIGGVLEVEVTLTFERPQVDRIIDRLKLVSRVEKELGQISGVEATFSSATLLPPLPRVDGSIRSIARRSVAERRLERQRVHFIESGFLADESGAEHFRIAVMISMLNWQQLHGIEQELQNATNRIIVPATKSGDMSVACEVASLGEVYEDIQAQLMRDLVLTYVTCVLAVGLIVCVCIRSLFAGVLLMIPNLMPAIVAIGTLSWLGIRLDVGSVLTASIALGVAVDDTMHFTMWYLRQRRSGISLCHSIHRTMQHCAPAMMQTTFVCGFGLLTLSISGFLPTARFGMLMSAMLFIALAGDMVLLPALLANRLGRAVFHPANPRGHQRL